MTAAEGLDEAVILSTCNRTERNVVPTIVKLREQVEEIRRSKVAAHLRRMHSLDDRDRNLVEALSMAIVNKLLHVPTVRLKEAAALGRAEPYTDTLRFLFNLKENANK